MAKHTVLVTGASRGIGKAIATRCLEDGLEVIGLSTTAREDLPWTHYGVDLAGPDAKAALGEIIARHRPCRYVGNAGVLINGRLEDVRSDDFDRLMRVNLLSLMETANLMLPVWAEEKFGRVVLIGSRAALGKENRVLYGASKAGLHGLTRAVAVDHGGDGIRCNAVAPGWIDTDLNIDFIESMEDPVAFRRDIGKIHPLGRTGAPEEVAGLITFLASPDAGFITGQVYTVDGGRMTKLSLP